MEKKVEDMIEEKPGKMKTRGKMTRNERALVKEQMRDWMIRGRLDKGTAITLLKISGRQYDRLLSEIKKENVLVVKEVGVDFIGEKIKELDKIKEQAMDAWHGAENENAKAGFMNSALKAIDLRNKFMESLGLMNVPKLEAEEEIRKAKTAKRMTREELEERQKRIIRAMRKRSSVDGRFKIILDAEGGDDEEEGEEK